MNTTIMSMLRRLSFVFPDEFVISLKYRLLNGHFPDLKHPKTFNEKLLWLNLHNHDPLLNKLVDKYEVRDFVRERIGEKYLVPLVAGGGIWNNADEIDFEQLPNQFVLKCTHDSGSVIICKDKSTFDVEAARKKLNQAVKRNYYYHSREWAYKNVPGRIIGEELIPTADGNVPKDYKIFCFNGEPKMFYVASDGSNHHELKMDYYTIDCEHIPVTTTKYPNSNKPFEKPKHIEEMIECARKLSAGFPQVRVDFYEDKDGNVLMGELTFISSAGMNEFKPDEYNYKFGEMIDLSSFGV